MADTVHTIGRASTTRSNARHAALALAAMAALLACSAPAPSTEAQPCDPPDATTLDASSPTAPDDDDAEAPPLDDAGADPPDAACPPAAPSLPAPPFLTPHGCVVSGGDSRIEQIDNLVMRATLRLGVVPYTDVGQSGIYAATIDSTRFAQIDRPALLACDAGRPLYTLEVGVNDFWHGDATAPTTAAHVAGIIAQAHDAGARVLLILDPGARVVAPALAETYRDLEREAGADFVADPCGQTWRTVVYDSGADASALPWTADKIHGLGAFEACAADNLYPALVEALQ